MAILDIHDLGIAREKGRDLVGVMALVQRPLAAVLAQPGIRSPKDLEGKRAGVTGLPSDSAVLRSVVAGAGGDADRVRETTIGFEAVKALLARAHRGRDRVLERRGRRPAREAPGHPRVPGRRLRRAQLSGARPDVTRSELEDHRRSCAPRSARSSAATRGPRTTRRARSRRCSTVSPASTAPRCPPSSTPSPPPSRPGPTSSASCDRHALRQWAAWDARFGILKAPIDVTRAFDTTLVRRPPTP